MAAKQNFDARWKTAREQTRTLQGAIRCTWADIFVPTENGLIKKVFTFQRSQSNRTLIQDDFIAELNWLKSTGNRTSPWGELKINRKDGSAISSYVTILGEHNYFNPNSLHLGRLTDAAISVIASKADKTLIQYVQEYPVVLYRPVQWSWDIEVETPVTEYNTSLSKANDMILLGTASSLAMLVL